MADIQKRGSYTPRRAREQRAYQLVVAGGSVAGLVGVVGLVLAIAGVVGGDASDHRADRRGDLRRAVPAQVGR